MPPSSELSRRERPEPPQTPQATSSATNAHLADVSLPTVEVPPQTPPVKLEMQPLPSHETESVYSKASTDTAVYSPVAKSLGTSHP